MNRFNGWKKNKKWLLPPEKKREALRLQISTKWKSSAKALS